MGQLREQFDKWRQSGENNSQWKGDDAGYRAMHYRVEQSRGTPQHCEACGATHDQQYDWASRSGNHQDMNDYVRLCRSCHMKMDKST